MSRIGDLENAIVSRLAGATISGSPAFAVVRGATGGWRPWLRDVIGRERMPAAYVAFTDEVSGPDANALRLGPRFSVFVAVRSLRLPSNPRAGDVSGPGALTLIDQVTARLDDHEPAGSTHLYRTEIRFVEAEERMAVYEVRYRAYPLFVTLARPAAPTGLTASPGAGDGAVTLAWTAPAVTLSSGAAEYYLIYRKGPSDASYVLIATRPRDVASASLTGQPSGVLLQYCVAAANVGGESVKSNAVSMFFGIE